MRASAALFLTVALIKPCARPQATPFEDAHMPGGAGITGLARLSGSPPIWLAGSRNGRVFRSADGGRNWRPVLQGAAAEVRSIRDLGGGVVLAGAGLIFDGVIDCFIGACTDPYAPGGIFRSRDQGLTWSKVSDGGSTAFSTHGGKLFAATRQGVEVSQDSGLTWRKLAWASLVYGDAPTRNTRDMAWYGDSLIFMKRGELSAMAYWQGDTLRDLGPGAGSDVQRRYLFSSPPWLYAKEWKEAAGASLKRTRDGGATWETLAPIAPYLIVPGRGGMIAFADSGVYSSADARAWTRIVPATRDQALAVEALAASGDTLFAGGFNDGGVAIHEPGSEGWRVSGSGMHDHATPGVAYFNGTLYAADGEGGLLARPHGTDAWSARADSVGSAAQVLPWNRGLFATPGYAGISRMDPASGRWMRITAIGSALADGGDWLGAFDGQQFRLVVCTGTPSPACETAAMEGFQQPPWISPTSGLYLHPFQGFAISGDTVLVALDRLWLSPDRGAHWSEAGNAPVQPAFLSARDGRFWLGGRDSLFLRDPGGVWRPVPLTGCRGNLTALAFRPGGDAILAGDSGVFYRKNGETAWTDISDGLSDRAVRSLAIEGDDLAVGLQNGGVWTRSVDPVSIRRPAAGIRAAVRYPGRYGAWRAGDGSWRRADGKALMPPAGDPRARR